MKPPEWISEFVFLQDQWSEIVALSAAFPNLKDYDLQQDWQAYTGAFQTHLANTDWFKKLRQFRQSRLAFLAYKDLSEPLDQHLRTMHLVADLADLLIQQAHQVAAKEMQARYGCVIDEKGETVEMMIWALGKLGTRELNYSSDVDLVFLYSQPGTSDGKRSLDAASYFTRLGQKIIKLLDHFTQDGQVYRVDMRLRPFGSAGPLVCSALALQQYLQYEGREWERFAWMRGRLISGLTDAAAAVSDKLTPFIYRKHLDYTVFSALAKIKGEIADHLDYAQADLKQGAGGIRAVEFIVQSLQLVFGGRNTHLQGTAISESIQQLIDAGKLPDDGVLNQAWLWLRKLENISQAVADQATHQIPDNAVVKQVISDCFDAQDWSAMQAGIDTQRRAVERLFNQLFAEAENHSQLSDEQKIKLQNYMQGITNKRLPRKRQDNIEQLLQNSLQLAAESTVKNFLVLVKKILTRPNYILMLLRETNVHQAVLNLMAKHPYFVTTLQDNPALLEQLFEREKFTFFTVETLASSWHKQNTAEVEDWMEALRYFKLFQQFKLMLAWSDKQIDRSQTTQQMTFLAEFILSEVVRYSHQEMLEKVGDLGISSEQIIVIAYGSAASQQMTVGSDLDLVFVIDVESLNPDAYLFAQKWVRRIVHHLATPMYHGKLYELDMQLRPNGNSGALITTKSEFAKYQANEAWVWEHAAMIKSRAIYATAEQAQWHQKLRADVLRQKRDNKSVDQALQEMADKLEQRHQHKKHRAEFKVLAGVLKNSRQYPQLTTSLNVTELRDQLLDLQLLNADCVADLGQKKDPAS